MTKLLRIAAALGLALTIIPSLLIHLSDISIEDNKNYMAIGAVIWFITAPILLRKKVKGT